MKLVTAKADGGWEWEGSPFMNRKLPHFKHNIVRRSARHTHILLINCYIILKLSLFFVLHLALPLSTCFVSLLKLFQVLRFAPAFVAPLVVKCYGWIYRFRRDTLKQFRNKKQIISCLPFLQKKTFYILPSVLKGHAQV